MSSVDNKVKDAMRQDKEEGRHAHTAVHAQPRTDATTHGAGVGGRDDKSYMTSDNYSFGSDNRGADAPASKTDGPHESSLANKLDPRVDSDRDHSKNLGANPRGTATTGDPASASSSHKPTTHGTVPAYATTGAAGTASRRDGPHTSDVANKADPRVDSDRDGSRNMGANPQGTSTTTGYGHDTVGLASGATAGHHHDTRYSGDITEANRGQDKNAPRADGPHSSDLANKLDPRVDSDRDHSKNMGANPQGSATTGNNTASHGVTGATGTLGTGSKGAPEGTHGPHSSRVANAADPRVDSDRDGSHNAGAAHSRTHTGAHAGTHQDAHSGTSGAHKAAVAGTHTTGPAPSTAGPHKSDLLNKLDPRVDSDLDGSKTIGGDKTHARS